MLSIMAAKSLNLPSTYEVGRKMNPGFRIYLLLIVLFSATLPQSFSTLFPLQLEVLSLRNQPAYSLLLSRPFCGISWIWALKSETKSYFRLLTLTSNGTTIAWRGVNDQFQLQTEINNFLASIREQRFETWYQQTRPKRAKSWLPASSENLR